MSSTATSTDPPAQTGPIIVYGATGYTGKLVAAELARRDADFVIAGRSQARLDEQAAALGGGVSVAAVPLDDGAGMRTLLADAGAVIACAGPFVKHGEAVLSAAAEGGTHYVDTTGEQPFMRSVFDRWAAVAESSGAALVTGMGFDYVPGDLIAALTAAELGRVDLLTLAYTLRGFGVTRGTALSALGMLGADDVEWVDGQYRDGSRNVAAGHFDFPSPIGRRRVGRYPAGEQITVPRHLDVGTVRELIDMAAVTPALLGPLAAPLMTATAYLMETPARGLTEKLIARLPEGPDERARRAARFTIVCEASGPEGHRRGVIRGSDIYGLTAVTTVEGALRMASSGYEARGALAPAQAYDAADFLETLAPHGVSYATEELD